MRHVGEERTEQHRHADPTDSDISCSSRKASPAQLRLGAGSRTPRPGPPLGPVRWTRSGRAIRDGAPRRLEANVRAAGREVEQLLGVKGPEVLPPKARNR